MRTSTSSALGAEAGARLRTIILFDVAAALAGSVFTVVMAFVTDATEWLLATGLFIALIAGTMAAGLVPLRRDDPWTALLWLAGSNWAAALWSAAIATFAWPIMIQAALLPAAVGALTVRGPRLTVLWAMSFAVACLVAFLGLTQDVTGLSDDVPGWTKTSVLLIFLPVMSGLVVLAAVQSSVQLHSALDRAIESQDELRRSRSRVVVATDRERRRIERDLHDGAQSRLVAINLRLRHARTLLETDPVAASETLELLREELLTAQTELRDLARGVYPPVLTQHGLAPAIQAAADRCPVPVRLDIGDAGRHSDQVESAVYFCVLEAMQNAIKHARCQAIAVGLSRGDGTLRFRVRDDGAGFDADIADRSGLDNLRDRLGAVGGELTIRSTPGSGTEITGWVPVPTRDSAGPEGPAERVV